MTSSSAGIAMSQHGPGGAPNQPVCSRRKFFRRDHALVRRRFGQIRELVARIALHSADHFVVSQGLAVDADEAKFLPRGLDRAGSNVTICRIRCINLEVD